jgi:hypothetical protein
MNLKSVFLILSINVFLIGNNLFAVEGGRSSVRHIVEVKKELNELSDIYSEKIESDIDEGEIQRWLAEKERVAFMEKIQDDVREALTERREAGKQS